VTTKRKRVVCCVYRSCVVEFALRRSPHELREEGCLPHRRITHKQDLCGELCLFVDSR
jgi:hypothetical protein